MKIETRKRGTGTLAVLLLFAAILLSTGEITACTIGVASGSATSDGRPLIWKNRDNTGQDLNGLIWNQSGTYPYVGMVDADDSTRVWFGVNNAGFAILNSKSSDLLDLRDYNNGDLMRDALALCGGIDDFRAHLDSTNTTGRDTWGNFAVLDATGSARLFEISTHQWWEYNPDDAPGGWIIRTNFSLQGQGTAGMARYNRSTLLISDLVSRNELNPAGLLESQIRDFSMSESFSTPIPFDDRWAADIPHGYVDIYNSICGTGTVSAVIIQGILPGEPVELTTMWTVAGFPGTSVAIPVFPVGEPPSQLAVNNPGNIPTRALLLKQSILDLPDQYGFLDSYQLRNPESNGLWDIMLPVEDDILQSTGNQLELWRTAPPQPSEMLDFQRQKAQQGIGALNDFSPVQTPVADFSVDITEGNTPLTVQFTDRSLHAPAVYLWDFDGDGMTDATSRDPVYTFNQPGVYSVTLRVESGSFYDVFAADSLITVHPGEEPPQQNAFYPPAPNPFADGTSLRFTLAEPGNASVKIYDIRGRLVKTITRTGLAPGLNDLYWDGRDDRGEVVATGVYLYRLEISGISRNGKLLRLK